MDKNVQAMETNYPRVRFRRDEIDGYPYLTAETEPLQEGDVKREHLRIIGDKQAGVAGHPIVYSDSYSSTRPDETYVYARHRVDQVKFFASLDTFLEHLKSDLHEMTAGPFRCVLGREGELDERQIALPFSRHADSNLKAIDFLRLSVPFGDMSVEFGKATSHDDQLKLAGQNALAMKLESPLFGFDALASDLWVPFLAGIHWASGLIQPTILQRLIHVAVRVKA
jgi:hypothetical protein